MNRTVTLEQSGIVCAAGTDIEAIWRAIAQDRRCGSDLPFPPVPGTPWTQAFAVDEPDLAGLGLDRRALRTMEKQARLALQGAALALQGSAAFNKIDKDRIGLYLGLPVVDDPVPPWPVLQAMHDDGLPALTTELCLRETPPFSALSDLNSSAGAHIAAHFGMTGAMGFCSPDADAGLQALIEAAQSIAEGENDAALAGAVAPKLNPLLMLQYGHRGWLADPMHVPGEGAAFVMLSADTAPGVRIGGHARGFACDGPRDARRRDEVAMQAVQAAGLAPADIGWTLRAEQLWPWCGDMGPALPMLALLLAAHGLRRRRRLCLGPRAAEEPMGEAHALVTAGSHEGQCVAVVLTKEAA